MRIQSLALLAALCLAAPLAGQAPANPGFEAGAPELSGWQFTESAGASMALDSVDAHGGRWSVRMEGTAGGGPQGSVGTLVQGVDPAPYRGRRIRYRAWMRTDIGGPGRAGLWLRVDRPGGAVGFFDNMESRPVAGRTGWTQYEIVGDVAPDAQAIAFGMLMTGLGRAWFDDATMEPGRPLAPPEPARPVTERGLQNLVAFSRLLGYVRFYHPSDPAAATDWNAFAAAGMRAVEGAPDARRLAAVLDSLFRPIAPSLVVRAGDVGQTELAPPAGDSLRVVWWRHYGVGLGNPRAPMYQSQRLYAPAAALPDSAPDPRRPLRVDLGGGVTAALPLALYADAAGTLPRAAAVPEPAGAVPLTSGDDRATRLAAVALGWNVMQHFYPYFDVVQTDWAAELPRALRSAATDPGECAFLATLQRMIAALHDGHGRVSHACEAGQREAPAIAASVEDRPTLVAVAPGTEGVRPGDVVLRVDGLPADSLLRAAGELASAATPQWRRWLIHDRLLAGRDSLVRVTVQHVDGDTATVTLRRLAPRTPMVEPRPEPVAQLRPGIWYMDLTRVTADGFRAALPDLAGASGLIFDMRGYPSGSPAASLLGYLVREPSTSARWTIPVTTRPDRADLRYDQRPGWDIRPAEPYLATPRVFLTDGRAISYAESVMGIVEAYRMGEIIGGATAGTNGNVNPLVLPGGYYVGWTGMRVLKHDGSRHHGVGVVPTVPLERTRAGVAAGRDELLERALEIVTRGARP